MPAIAPGIALECVDEVGVVLARHGEAVDGEPEDDGAEQRAEERADDARPEAVGDEDREVPDGESHHHPDERAHQRGLPWRRLRDFFCLASPPPSAGGLGASPCGRGAGLSVPPAARARARRPPAGRPAAAAAGLRADASSMPRLRTMSSKSVRETRVGSCGAVIETPARRRSLGSTSIGAPDVATAYAG